MKAYIITTGHFSKAGNFIGYSTKGERIHIYKKQIFQEFPQVGIVYRCQGRYEKELIKFPFYCMAEHLTFDNPDGTTFTRLTANEISKSKLGIVEHSISDWVADAKQAVSDRAAERISQELARAKKNYYNRLENKYDQLQTDYADLLCKTQGLQWDYEYAQTERERLELLCKQQENIIYDYKHILGKIKGLSSVDDDINNINDIIA